MVFFCEISVMKCFLNVLYFVWCYLFNPFDSNPFVKIVFSPWSIKMLVYYHEIGSPSSKKVLKQPLNKVPLSNPTSKYYYVCDVLYCINWLLYNTEQTSPNTVFDLHYASCFHGFLTPISETGP